MDSDLFEAQVLIDKLSNYKCYFFNLDSFWRVSNRITFYYGSLKSWQKKVGEDSFLSQKESYVQDEEQGVKFLGLAEVNSERVFDVMNTIGGESNNVIFFSQREHNELFERLCDFFLDKMQVDNNFF